jgi:hypothetical protein
VAEWIALLNEGGNIPVTERARIRQGARCFMEAIRTRLWLRGPGKTWISWQTSHSGAPTASATLLARADETANIARKAERPVQPPEYQFHEERLIWSRRDILTGRQYHILGDVRRAIIEQIRQRRLAEWSRLETQGELIRRALEVHPGATHTLLDACRGFRSLRSDHVLTYATLAMASHLPTEYRLARMRSRRARGAGLPVSDEDRRDICRLCRTGSSETMHHVLSCPALAPTRTLIREKSEWITMKCVQESAPDPGCLAQIRAITRVLLSSRTDADLDTYERLCPSVPWMTVRVVRGWPRWLLHLGVFPACLSAQLTEAMARAIAGEDGPWALKQARRRTSKLVVRLARATLWAGFNMWAQRTRMLRAWWRSPEAVAVRESSQDRKAEIKRAREEKRAARQAAAEAAVEAAARARVGRVRRRAAIAARGAVAAMAILLQDERPDPDPQPARRVDHAAVRFPLA